MQKTIIATGGRDIIAALAHGKKSVTITDLSFIFSETLCPYDIQPDTEVLIVEGLDWKDEFATLKKLASLSSVVINKKGQESFNISPKFYVIDPEDKGLKTGFVENLINNIFQDKLNAASGQRSCLEKGISDLHSHQEKITNLLHKVWPEIASRADLLDLKNEVMQLVLRASQNMQQIDKCRCV